MNKLLPILLAVCLLVVGGVQAFEQTQQYNKIYLNPFYINAMAVNTNVTFNVTVNPPDGISTVNSAIITFNGQINGQTQTFNIWVNGGACNTPTYSVATAFSTTGNVQFSFDCSNRITKAGVYNVTLRSAVATGAMSGSLELTYMNNPTRKIQIFGTEYTIGDNGKIFVQLLENSITPINNASCYLTVYTPSGTKWYDKSLMSYQTGSNALYYFDFTAPVTLGVYMTDIYCEYYTVSQTNNASAYSQASGWYISGNGASVTNVDSDYLVTAERNTNTGALTNVTTVLMAHLDEYTGTSTLDSSTTPATGTHYNTPTIGISGQAGSAGVGYTSASNDYTQFTAASKFNLGATEAYMVCLSFNQSVSNANGNRLFSAEGSADTIRISFEGGNQIRLTSDRSGSGGQTVQTSTSYIDSLWHTVCGYSNFTTLQLYVDGSLAATTTATQSGTLTVPSISFGAKDGGTGNDATVHIDEVCYIKGTQTNFNAPTPQQLATNYNTNKQCGTPTNTLDLNVSISGVTVLANYINWNIVTTYRWDELVETADMYVFNYTGGTWYKLPNALSYAVGADSIVSSQLTNNISHFISGGVMTFKMNDSQPTGPTIGRLSLNQIRLVQTAYAQTPATQIRGGGEIHVNDIPTATWNVPIRTLTSFPNITVDNNAVATAVWNATDRNLTFYPAQTDLTNYSKISNITPDDVWNYSNRSLTFYPPATVNTTAIAQDVWNYTGTVNSNILTQIGSIVWSTVGRYINGVLG